MLLSCTVTPHLRIRFHGDRAIRGGQRRAEPRRRYEAVDIWSMSVFRSVRNVRAINDTPNNTLICVSSSLLSHPG